MNDPADRLYERLLVLRCQMGDPGAPHELIERYAARLRYFLRKQFPDPSRADDVAQEVWLDVFRQLPRLADAGAFKPWIYQIARGKTMLELRRNGRLPRPSDQMELVAAPEAEPEFDPDDAARIHLALDRLPHEQREVLVLRFLDDLSYEEIAQIVGCPLGTVRSRIHYAKQALKRVLQ